MVPEGSTRNLTFEIAELLRRFRFSPVMPHLTCVGSSVEELLAPAVAACRLALRRSHGRGEQEDWPRRRSGT